MTGRLDVTHATIYRLVKDGKLVLVKIGKRSSGVTAESLNRLLDKPANDA